LLADVSVVGWPMIVHSFSTEKVVYPYLMAIIHSLDLPATQQPL
jgi:hypothetical protein